MSGGYTKSRAKMSIPARSATQRIITCNRQTNDLNAPQAGVALPRNVHLPTLPMHANHVVSDCLFARSSPQNVFDRSPHAKELATNTHNPRRTLLDRSHNGVEGTCPLAGTLHTRHCPVKGKQTSHMGPQTKGREGGNNQLHQLFNPLQSAAISRSSTSKVERAANCCKQSEQDWRAWVGSVRCMR